VKPNAGAASSGFADFENARAQRVRAHSSRMIAHARARHVFGVVERQNGH
jgi:hypothetical protein